MYIDKAPQTALNFLKLCKIKYYNFSPFYNIEKEYTCESGDPNYPLGNGGSSIWGVIDNHGTTEDSNNSLKRFFKPEIDIDDIKLTHKEIGTVSMATTKSGNDYFAASQFIITLAPYLKQLDGKVAVFGKVVEGFETLTKINNAFVDDKGRPLKDIRINHTYILEDPFPDPPNIELLEKETSPEPTPLQLSTVRLTENELLEDDTESTEAIQKKQQREMRSQALTLEMIGDLPFAEVKPMENVLFVCKLNPVTRDEDLELIFSRFGKIVSCEVIRDKSTGDSLQYAFIEFEEQENCERAYFKMDGVLIDEHRIHVDFSQSVSRLTRNWRDETNAQRKAAHGSSFRETLKENTKRDSYRSEGRKRDERDNDYSRSNRHRSRSRPTSRDRYSDRDRKRERERPRRENDKYRSSDRNRDETARRSRYDRDDQDSRHRSERRYYR